MAVKVHVAAACAVCVELYEFGILDHLGFIVFSLSSTTTTSSVTSSILQVYQTAAPLPDAATAT
jgi:hypothetical protein